MGFVSVLGLLLGFGKGPQAHTTGLDPANKLTPPGSRVYIPFGGLLCGRVCRPNALSQDGETMMMGEGKGEAGRANAAQASKQPKRACVSMCQCNRKGRVGLACLCTLVWQ